MIVVLGVHATPFTGNGLFGAQTIAVIGVGILGVWSSRRAIRYFNHVDPSPVVIDEVFGQIVTFWGIANPGWQRLVIGFILFRVMDIFKPFSGAARRKASGRMGNHAG